MPGVLLGNFLPWRTESEWEKAAFSGSSELQFWGCSPPFLRGSQLPTVITSGLVLPLLSSFSSPLPSAPLVHPRIPSQKGHLDPRHKSLSEVLVWGEPKLTHTSVSMMGTGFSLTLRNKAAPLLNKGKRETATIGKRSYP